MTLTYTLTQDFLNVKAGTLIKVKNGVWFSRLSGERRGFISEQKAQVSIQVDYFPKHFRQLSVEEEQAIKDAEKLLRKHNTLFLSSTL